MTGNAPDDDDETTTDARGAPLHLASVDVHRAPGFASQGFGVDDLSPGVTIVHGPNGSGKSTLARAIQWVLWPEAAPTTARLAAQFDLDGSDWRTDVDGGSVSVQRNGDPASRPSLPPPVERDRYHLSLHDLLQADERNERFASTIRRESAGGYDLDAAHDALGYDDDPGTRGMKVVDEAERALETRREAKTEAEALRREERRLDGLERELSAAKAAAERVDAIDAAIEYADARDAVVTAEAELASFQDVMSRVEGDELEAVDDLTSRIEDRRAERQDAIDERDDAAATLDDVDLPRNGLPDGFLSRVRGLRDDLDDLETRHRQTKSELEGARDRRMSAREAIPFQVDADALESLDSTAAWPAVAAFAQLAETVQADRELAAAVDRWLGTPPVADQQDDDGSPQAGGDARTTPPGSEAGAEGGIATDQQTESDAESRAPPDLDPEREASEGAQTEIAATPSATIDDATLDRGRRALENWLAHPPADAGPEHGAGDRTTRPAAATAFRIATVAGGAVALAAVTLGLLVDALGFAGIFLAIAIVIWGYRTKTTDDDGDGMARSTYRDTYAALPLVDPESWTETAVRDRLTDIYDQIAARAVDVARQQRREMLAPEYAALEERTDRLDAKREEIREHLGGAPTGGDVGLAVTVQTIGRWQDANDDVRELETTLETVDAQLDEVRAELERAVEPYGYDDVPDAPTAKGVIEALADRATEHRQATTTLERAERTIEAVDRTLADLEAERDAIYTDLDLDPGDRDGLAALCEQAPAYADAAAVLSEASVRADAAKEALEAEPAFEPALATMERTDLRAKRDEAAAAATDVDSIQEEITTIETRITDAKQATSLEAARADAERALDALEAQFEADAAAMVGDVLVDHVSTATRESSRPAVFERARGLLARITHGRYELRLDETDADASTFRAYDSVTERGYGLEELSSGTQLQVLLAVRIAFVEHQEHGVRLPLVLDETLANTDDQRAGVIIDAMLELARGGRQILYFTAQGDEVAKWQAALEAAGDVEYAVVDLAAERDLDRHVTVPALDAVTDHDPALPDPGEHDHERYGDALDVPAFDPRRGAGGTHLWYLVTDVDVLHDLLELGVERWGELSTLVETGYADVFVDDRSTLDAIERRGSAVDAFVRAWLVGRGDPVDRAALEATDAVSENFIDEVSALADSVDGDAERIIERLRNRAVSGFRRNKIDELESYFNDHGYIDPADTLDPSELRVRVVDVLTTEDRSRTAATAEATALFDRLDR